ncbi:MAG: glucosyl-3-phosphoglycerate synthase [Bacillati bacterium ANGP1]|uniref:Glucosyl-3-phosphoglycerate synthase n=1 Tax=Candidatus Segetimicrobium genomatis TaxID=2569760 RepID=A0A537JG23_9BACT|nr:MAG: glucosyl-3-phosphoglycerate synthase [Terrabacteria group bacterium ANGP1]
MTAPSSGPPHPARGGPGAARNWPAAASDAWFAGHTFDAEEFGDLDALLALKRARGVTISLGLPALNEQPTIGREIQILRRALIDEVPFLDEIVVIDSGSVDGTAEVARRLGVPTYHHAEILPGEGTYTGKGESLWKSLHILRGDLVAWVDRIGYVKGFYRRPIRLGGRRAESGGGRVTELTARPLLNLFFPELAGVIQPLAGEYAGRREILERLPFFTGYGVEIGLLIDVLRRFGLDQIGQVNLGSRVHRNRDLTPLSVMAFAIAQVVMTRVGERIRAPLGAWMHTAINLVSPGGALSLERREVRERERPPIMTVPEYRRRRALVGAAGRAATGAR